MIVAFFLYLGAVDMNFLWLFGKSPGWLEISQHKTSVASEIYSADGVLIGKFSTLSGRKDLPSMSLFSSVKTGWPVP